MAKAKIGIFMTILSLLLSPSLITAVQEEDDIQNKPDYWCSKIVFVGKAAEIFKLKKCEHISGITIKIVFNGKYPYPSKLKLTLLDSDGNVMEEDKKKHVFGPQHLKKGQYGIFTIWCDRDPSIIQIEGVWEENKGVDAASDIPCQVDTSVSGVSGARS